jgi:hypothetical protein
VSLKKQGRVRTYTIAPQPLKAAEHWLTAQRVTWERCLHVSALITQNKKKFAGERQRSDSTKIRSHGPPPRSLVLILFFRTKNARRIFAIVSTTSILILVFESPHGSHCGPAVPGSRSDAAGVAFYKPIRIGGGEAVSGGAAIFFTPRARS